MANLLEATASKTFCGLLLDRVEMWCARHLVEATAAATAALAAGATQNYQYWRGEQLEWLRAFNATSEACKRFKENRQNGDRI